jgi:hypothetical protein
MQIDSLYSSELYWETYKNYKYFNHSPWEVAMTKNIREEFNYFKKLYWQEVLNGTKDFNEYLVLLKLVLDGPLIYFENKEMA